MAPSRRRRSQEEPPCRVGGCSRSSVKKQAGHHPSVSDGRGSCAACRDRPFHGRRATGAGPRFQQAQRGTPPHRPKELTCVQREDRREDGREKRRDDGWAGGCSLFSVSRPESITVVDDATLRQMTGCKSHLCPVTADECTRNSEDVTHGGKATTGGTDSAPRDEGKPDVVKAIPHVRGDELFDAGNVGDDLSALDPRSTVQWTASLDDGEPRIVLSGTGSQAESLFRVTQRRLLSKLEELFSTIMDRRRQSLADLRQEEEIWLEAAKGGVRNELLEERLAREGDLREELAREGPGAGVLESVGLVKAQSWAESGTTASSENQNFTRWKEGRGFPGERGWRTRWALPPAMVASIRREFETMTEGETALPVTQEDAIMLEARTGFIQPEYEGVYRELEELRLCLTDDERGALASLQRELEVRKQTMLEEQRARLKKELACVLETENKRLIEERGARIADARSFHRARSANRTATLRDEATRRTSRRKEEAIRLLDQAAQPTRASTSFNDLLRAQADKDLRDLQDMCSTWRQTCLDELRSEEKARCLSELDTRVDKARQDNDAWLRTTMNGLGVTLTEGDISQGSQDIHHFPWSCGLKLKHRAREAISNCSRLGQRLVELIDKEMRMYICLQHIRAKNAAPDQDIEAGALGSSGQVVLDGNRPPWWDGCC